MGTRETREKRRDDGGLAKEAYFIDIVFFFSPTRVLEQTLAPIRIAGLEQLDGPSTYRHAVQQQCSRCVLCLSWAGLASWEVLELVLAGDLASVCRQTLFNVCCQCGGAGAGAQRWAAQTGEKKSTGPKEEKGKEKKKSGWGCGRWKRL